MQAHIQNGGGGSSGIGENNKTKTHLAVLEALSFFLCMTCMVFMPDDNNAGLDGKRECVN